ncbi:hypothetical protein COV19_07375 [Candidatus Woesearchaeota archaeon CG10_big_fil_rev_8_21_14_0_10_44_13]|nr:MAG: hypothetical protein COV19_07375 [Candidatus Woesearchaeota archaeon CG10_big_fil_rev_8_21_14_0_10_44_13]
MKSKTRSVLQIIALFCIYLIIDTTMVHALIINYDPVSDIDVSGAQATIRWTTDAEADSKIEYGTTQSLGSSGDDPTSSTSHSITLTGLGAAATYYYKLTSSGNGEIATADNFGSLYSFTTPAASADTDTAPPQFNVTLPQYYNRRQITFGGYTKPDSILRLYLNANQADIGTDKYIQLTTSDASGHFIFKYVNLIDDNQLTIWAKDPSGSTNSAAFHVIVDADSPVVQMKEPPALASSTTVAINGSVNEDVTVTIAVNNDTKTQEVKAGNFNLMLSLKEGIKNDVDLQFSDKAGNVFEKEYRINVDTEGPKILWNNLRSLDPSYIQDVYVEGNVSKPGATIVIFVNNKTYSSEAWSTSVRDMLFHYGSILGDGDQKYVTKADERGHFRIKVFLTQEIITAKSEYQQDVYKTSPAPSSTGPGGAPTTYGTSNTAVGRVTSGSTGRYSNAWDNNIVIVAMDELGRSDKQSGIITFARCGYGADWNILVKNPTPSVITPEHLRQGIAQIAFAVNLEWQGPGTKQKLLRDPVVQQYKLSDEMKKDYVFDPNQLVSGVHPVWSQDRKRGYVVIDLNKKDYQQKNLTDLKKEDLLVKLPMQVELEYQYDDGSGSIVTGIQKQCWDITTVLDVRIPPSVIPKELLNASVQFLNSTITAINKILKPLKAITIVVFVTCLLSWVMYFFALMRKAYDCMDSKDGKTKSDACLESEANAKKVEKYMHYVCDRIFCPSVPTADYYLQEMASKDCRGKPLSAAMSKDDNACGQEYMDQWDSGCLLMNELERSKCIRYQEGDSQFQESCAESGQMLKNIWYGASDFCRKKETQQARVFSVTKGKETQQYVLDENGKAMLVVSETSQAGLKKTEGGYVTVGRGGSETKYNTGPFETFSEGNKDINVNDYDDQGRLYYTDSTGKKNYVCKEQGGIRTMNLDEKGEPNPKELERGCKPMTLPPEIMDAANLPNTQKYVVKPTDNLLTAMQCVCLPAINGFLTLWRNMLGAIMQCFQSILITGDGSTGLCRSVLTTYICDIIFDAIRCFVNRYGGGMASRQDERGGISSFFKSAATAGGDIQESITGRYGQSALYKTMFSERKLIHAACLWAFTGDFDFDIGSALTGPGAIPLKSKAFLYPRTRRFIASNPLNGYTTHIYHIGAGLVAGADMSYKLQLVCSASDGCDPKEGFPNGMCDCAKQSKEVLKDITTSFGPGRLNAGEMLGPNEGDIYVKVSDDKYRYDTVRLTYWYKDNEGTPQTVVEEGRITQIGGNPPAECSFDLAGGVFRCAYEVGDIGYAIFTEVPKPEKKRYGLGDTVYLNFKIDKRSPQKPTEGLSQGALSSYDQIPFYLVYSVIPPKGGAAAGPDTIVPIIPEGITDYSGRIPGIVISEDTLMGRMTGKDYEVLSKKPDHATNILNPNDYDSGSMGSLHPDFAVFVRQTTDESKLTAEQKKDIDSFRTFAVKVCDGEMKENDVKGQIVEEFVMSSSCQEITDESKSTSDMGFETQPYKKILRVKYKGMTIDLRYASVPVVLKPAKDSWGVGFIMRYKPASTQSSVDCKTSFTTAKPAILTVKISLHPCRQKDDTLPKSLSNCELDPTVVDYFGTVQEYEIGIEAICSKTGEEEQKKCPIGLLLDKGCECRNEIVGRNNCGQDKNNGYCYYAVSDLKCVEYKTCPKSTAADPKIINNEITGVLIEAGAKGINRYYCDCDNYPDMEDCTGKYCYDNGKSGYGCYPDAPQSS